MRATAGTATSGLGTPPGTHHSQGVVHVGVVPALLHARGGLGLLGDQAEEAGKERERDGEGAAAPPFQPSPSKPLPADHLAHLPLPRRGRCRGRIFRRPKAVWESVGEIGILLQVPVWAQRQRGGRCGAGPPRPAPAPLAHSPSSSGSVSGGPRSSGAWGPRCRYALASRFRSTRL